MTLTRREFNKALGASLLAIAMSDPCKLFAADSEELNILCWEGYNTDDVLGPFRKINPGSKIRAESGTSDPDMINKLRAGEVKVWDLINVNQPWARNQLFPEGLIRPLDKDRFLPFFEKMSADFAKPYPLAFAGNGDLIGMPQRYGPFSFVVNSDKISKATAEDEGWNLFLDPKMKGKYGILTYDNWNIIHMCLTAGLNPFEKLDAEGLETFKKTAAVIFAGSKMLSDDLVAMNTALINGEIDAYFTGGTYTASPARLDGMTNIMGITPKTGPVDGKGGVAWIELTSLVNNPQPTALAEDFLEFVQKPEIAKAVGFAEGTYNPVSQMGDKDVFKLWSADELEAIQWETLPEEMARSLEYDVVASYDELIKIYSSAKRS